jgi:hypothetical protein
MREQAEKDASRRADFKHRGWDVCMAELRVEVVHLIATTNLSRNACKILAIGEPVGKP